ncbi:helix-turn-helix domain-containing protein [Thalassiella azotivora]
MSSTTPAAETMVAATRGPALRQARRAAGIGQRQLARQAGVSQTHLSRFENGERPVSVTAHSHLTAALAVLLQQRSAGAA